MTKQFSNFYAADSFVRFGLSEKRQGKRESASGPGSSLHNANETIRILRHLIQIHQVQSILDLGCGDWHWFYHVGVGRQYQIAYEGWEANQELVDHLNTTYGTSLIKFFLRDITIPPYPKADLIIIRDVLFHLPIPLALRILEAVRIAAPLMLATSFPNHKSNTDIARYLPIDGWGFYPINLDIAPFDLRHFREMSLKEENASKLQPGERHVCVYNFNQKDGN